MGNKVWISLNDVIALAETEPNQNIWCISDDGSLDFLATASDIKKTIGNFDWTGVKFGIVGNSEEENNEENEDTTKIDGSIVQIAPKKVNHKIKLFSGTERNMVENEVNKFLENNVNGEARIEHHMASGNGIVYSVMVHYTED